MYSSMRTFSLILALLLYGFNCQKTIPGHNDIFLGPFTSSHWSISSSEKLADGTEVKFVVALKLHSVDEMKETLLKVSDPNSEQYGHHLSLKEINERFGPTLEEQKSAIEFFQTIEDALVDVNLQGDLICVTAKVGHIESALSTELGWHSHTIRDSKAIRAIKPLSIPDHVSNVLSFVSLNSPVTPGARISGVDDVRRVKQNHLSSESISSEAMAAVGGTTPAVLAARYGFPTDYKARLGSQAIPAFYSEFFSNRDLTIFANIFGLVPATIPLSNVFGNLPNNENDPGFEASLDTQYITAVAKGVSTYFYSMKNFNPYTPENEGFLEYAWIVGNQTDPPLVHSLSYGDIEAVIYDDNIPGAVLYAERTELEFMKMGLRGLTVIFASGDWGIGNFQSNAKRCLQSWPDFPGASPYVTCVGGTMLDASSKEIVCSANKGGVITSGGGFSDIHNRSSAASWQSEVVDAYLAKTGVTPPNTYFNRNGRGYPDISIIANSYPVVAGGNTYNLYGTSASAPVFAGIVSLLNDLRLSAGMPPMGFLNPFLYWAYKKDPSAFTDVISGDNGCGVGGQPCCANKFYASVGWDATTGLGTPNFDKLKVLAMSYETPPTSTPALRPTNAPSTPNPSRKPTNRPSIRPSRPSIEPSREPTSKPSLKPSRKPSRSPSRKPSSSPSLKPSYKPSRPSLSPSLKPSKTPSLKPTRKPTSPTQRPSRKPTLRPTHKPTLRPTRKPTLRPTRKPTLQPTRKPTI